MQSSYTGMPTTSQQRAPGGSLRRVLSLLPPVLVIVLIGAGIFWLQWASQRGITLGYPTPQVHINSSASGTQLINSNVQFSANGSGRDLTYSWDFGDQSTADGQSVTHSYQSAGSFTVTITVTDAIGRTSTDTTTVNVAPAPPTASFTFNVGYDGYYLDVSFDASSSSADSSTSIANYSWDFGDGNTDNTSSPQEYHSYPGSGSYTVTLTVTDATGQQSQAFTATVTI